MVAAKRSRTPFYLLILVFVAAGVGLTWHRHVAFDVPWLPGEKKRIWSVEAKVEFTAVGDPVKLSLAVPQKQPGFEVLGEHTASPGYGLAFVDTPSGRRAEWSIRRATGKQTLYYRVDMLEKKFTGLNGDEHLVVPPPLATHTLGDGPHRTAAQNILQQARSRSADAYTLARELIQEFKIQPQSAQFLLQKQSRSRWLVELLAQAGVPAREVYVLDLEDGRRNQTLNTYLQVFDKQEYQLFDPRTGRQGRRDNQMMWEYQSGALLDLIGGRGSSVHFSILEQEVPITQLLQREQSVAPAFLDFSIHSLPLEEQTLFKSILLIPVGVLLVVFMRIFIGLKTSGTFMPVLIAIAFIQTSLVVGLVGFLLVLSIGLIIRSYLSKLNLLLVARISAVIISVIIIIASFSVLAFMVGLSEGLKITFFPMIILSWTIERMSILWEEEGPKQVLVQGGGSLFVALLAYGLMVNDVVRHITFNFIGLQLIFMALVLILGSYTGYRLFELRRFKPLLARDNTPSSDA